MNKIFFSQKKKKKEKNEYFFKRLTKGKKILFQKKIPLVNLLKKIFI